LFWSNYIAEAVVVKVSAIIAVIYHSFDIYLTSVVA